LDENRISDLNEIVNVYNVQFSQTLNEFQNSDSKLDVEAFTKKLQINFEKGIKPITNNELSLKSGEKIVSEDFSIEPYLDELFTQLMTVDDECDKETTLKNMDNILQNNIEIIKLDDYLTNDEKQFIIENYILRAGVFFTILEYGDEIDGGAALNTSKSANKRCGWFCKNRVRVGCVALSISAAGVCGVAVVALTPPMTLGGLVMSGTCVTFANAAIACWTRWQNL